MRTDIAFPFRIDERGRTAEVDYASHVREMIELLLFTAPSERVMRSDFGCGLGDLVFEPNSPELAATLQLTVHAQLQRWLGDVIDVNGLDITSQDNVLTVRLSYTLKATGEQRTDVFEGSTQ
jgi:phage baseplate assembly protein W